MNKLTKEESRFVIYFLEDNHSGAQNCNALAGVDKSTHQMAEDIAEYQELTVDETDEFLIGLTKKEVVSKEDRDGLPDLFFVTDSFIEKVKESGQGHLPFERLKLITEAKK